MTAKLVKPIPFNIPFDKISVEHTIGTVKLVFWKGSDPSCTIEQALDSHEVLSLEVKGELVGKLE